MSKRTSNALATGTTLIELMVAMAIGAFLLLGAVTVFTQARATFRVNRSISRLQENGRFIVDIVGPDLRMAHFWGLTTHSDAIAGRASRQQPATGPSVAGDCNTDWTIDLDRDVEAANNGYTWACRPYRGTASPTADTLTVRRASRNPVTGPLDPGTLYIQSARVAGGWLFQGPPAPRPVGASQTYKLVVDGYYVSPTSSLSTPGNPTPSLRVKTLVPGPKIVDREVLPGVEDMQVRLGVDTDMPGAPGRGSVDRYVDPGDALLEPASASYMPNAVVLAVRVWFRLRAERREVGYSNTAHYVYADRNYTAPGDAYRRIVVSKTFYLRNARPAS